MSNSMSSSLDVANENINSLVHAICASVPQYLDCSSAAQLQLQKPKPSASPSGTRHSHSPSHTLDCYTIILPIFAAAYSQRPGSTVRSWCIEQLLFMCNHFGIRNAGSVARIRTGRGFAPGRVLSVGQCYPACRRLKPGIPNCQTSNQCCRHRAVVGRVDGQAYACVARASFQG